MRTRITLLAVLVFVLSGYGTAGAQVLYTTSKTIQGNGYSYRCEVKYGGLLISLYNSVYTDYVGKVWRYKDGSLIDDDRIAFGTTPTILLYETANYDQFADLKHIVNHAIPESEKTRLFGEKLDFHLYIPPETGVVAEVEFSLDIYSDFQAIPITTFRAIETALKEKLRHPFVVTEAGKRLNFVMWNGIHFVTFDSAPPVHGNVTDIPLSATPFLGTKFEQEGTSMFYLDENHVQYAINKSLWADLALKTPMGTGNFRAYRRFTHPSGNFSVVLTQIYNNSGYGKKMLITVSPTGMLLDQLEVSVWGPPCPGEESVQDTWFLKQWKQLSNGNVEVYQYEMYGGFNRLFTDYNYGSLYIMPSKTTYSIDSSGNFIQAGKATKSPGGYYATDLANDQIDLWDVFE